MAFYGLCGLGLGLHLIELHGGLGDDGGDVATPGIGVGVDAGGDVI